MRVRRYVISLADAWLARHGADGQSIVATFRLCKFRLRDSRYTVKTGDVFTLRSMSVRSNERKRCYRSTAS